MARPLTLGNGRILVGLDEDAQVRDFTFPYVGIDNHVTSDNKHRVGVWAHDHFSWLDDPAWDVSVSLAEDTLVGVTRAENDALGAVVQITDAVYNEKNVFLRRVAVTNTRKEKRRLKIFFGQEFSIGGTHRGDTAYYDPRTQTIVHYEGRTAFVINAQKGKMGFHEYSIGLSRIEGKDGAYKDAEDGKLSGNPIEHGRVDSVIGFELVLEAGGSDAFFYWVTVAETIEEATDLNYYVLARSPEHLIQTTRDYWKAWVDRQNFSFYGLAPEVVTLFKKSLLFVRAHTDDRGAIIASSDSAMLQYGRDTYSYMWPRDGALSALAMARAGDFNSPKRFFEFCNDVIARDGYFMHKYRSDRSLGSSWHPWVHEGATELPIQEDETALVVVALWEYYTRSRDLEFIERVYNSLIKKASDFLLSHLHEHTGLPNPTYDLWEEKYGTHTFTACATYAALKVAAEFASLLGKRVSRDRFLDGAGRVKKGIEKYLYNDERKMFRKLLHHHSGHSGQSGKDFEFDDTLDMSSFYGVVRFGVLPLGDERVVASFETVKRELLLPEGTVGGVVRYEGDRYYKNPYSGFSNPWAITTLWFAQYYIKTATSVEDFQEVYRCLNWAVDRALPSGALSEQFDPYTGAQLSASPLTWSHSEFVMTVVDYLEKAEELGLCKACYPIN